MQSVDDKTNSREPIARSFFSVLKMPAWLFYSLLTLVVWGVWGITSKILSDDINAYTNQVFFAIGVLPLLLLVVFSPRLKKGVHRGRGITFAFLTGILGGVGNIAFFKSLMVGGEASIVVPATSLSPIITVVLGYLILKERLSSLQKVGFALSLMAIYLLSI
jgi:transporter family protein